jgi:hypothetical protein
MGRQELTVTIFVSYYDERRAMYTRCRIENTAIEADEIIEDVPVAIRDFKLGFKVPLYNISPHILFKTLAAIDNYKRHQK